MPAKPCCSLGESLPTLFQPGRGPDQARGELSSPVALGMREPAQMQEGWPPSLAQESAISSRAVLRADWSCQLWVTPSSQSCYAASGNTAQHGPLGPGEPGRCSHHSGLCTPLGLPDRRFHSAPATPGDAEVYHFIDCITSEKGQKAADGDKQCPHVSFC